MFGCVTLVSSADLNFSGRAFRSVKLVSRTYLPPLMYQYGQHALLTAQCLHQGCIGEVAAGVSQFRLHLTIGILTSSSRLYRRKKTRTGWISSIAAHLFQIPLAIDTSDGAGC